MTFRSNRFYQLCTAAIILTAACVYLLGLGRVSLWDRDEAWYAQTSRQMLQTGDWVIPHFLEKPRTAKPILIYWCQATSMKVFGDNALGARFPSALAMTVTLCVLAVVLSKALGSRRAMYTVLIFATSGLVMVTAKMCIIDSVQLVFVTGAQICLFALYRAGAARARVNDEIRMRNVESITNARMTNDQTAAIVARRHSSIGDSEIDSSFELRHSSFPNRPTAWLAALLWLCVGLAGLSKGPFVLIVLFGGMLALAALDVGKQWKSLATWKRAISWWRLLRPLWGLPLALAVVLPWVAMAYARNPDFVRALFLEPKRHFSSNQSGQWPWPGYFLAAIWVTFFPWCLLLPGSLVLAWKHRATPQVRFALGLVLGNWVFVEMMTTKLPHYLLPAYASLAFLTATGLVRCIRSQYFELHKTGFFILAGVSALGALFMSNIPWMFGIYHNDYSKPAAAAFTVAGALYVAVVMGLFVTRRLGAAAVAMGLGMFVIVGILYGLYLPQAQFLRLPERIAADLKARGLTHRGQVMMIGYREPSLAFYQGGTIRDEDERSVLFNSSPADWPEWIVTTQGLFGDLDEWLPERADLLEVVSKHRGINYNTGCRAVDVLLLRKRALPAQ